MSEPTGRIVASVLVIAADPIIESLLGELVAFAGYHPLSDVTTGAAGESIRRIRPDVALIDTSLPSAKVDACLAAADEVGCRPVLMSSTDSSSELSEQARSQHCLYFPLPGGPKQLSRILGRALTERPEHPDVGLPMQRNSVHPAFCAALSSVARAQSLMLHVGMTRFDNRRLRDEMKTALGETQRSRAALRAAVTDYATQLKAADVSVDRVLSLVQEALRDCALVVGAESAMPSLLDESAGWTRQVYGAA